MHPLGCVALYGSMRVGCRRKNWCEYGCEGCSECRDVRVPVGWTVNVLSCCRGLFALLPPPLRAARPNEGFPPAVSPAAAHTETQMQQITSTPTPVPDTCVGTTAPTAQKEGSAHHFEEPRGCRIWLGGGHHERCRTIYTSGAFFFWSVYIWGGGV